MRVLATLMASIVCCSAIAATSKLPPVELAKETYNKLESLELFLGVATRDQNKDDYVRFVWRPAYEFLQTWPSIDTDGYTKYHGCRYALSDFQSYSDDFFKAGGKMDMKRPSAKSYLTNKALCKKALKGKL